MADPRNEPRTNVNVGETRKKSGNSALWLILGGVLVALAIYFFVFAGTDVAEDGEAGDGDTNVIVEDDAAPAATDTAPAPAETTPAPVETEPAPVETTPAPVETEPAPTDTAPAPADDTTPAPVN